MNTNIKKITPILEAISTTKRGKLKAAFGHRWGAAGSPAPVARKYHQMIVDLRAREGERLAQAEEDRETQTGMGGKYQTPLILRPMGKVVVLFAIEKGNLERSNDSP